MNRYISIYLIIYSIICFASSTVLAKPTFKVVLEDAAPGEIKAIFQDDDGFIWLGGSVALYALTRLPIYANRLSLPIVVAVLGPFLLLPNVAFNEWGHAFWNAEEIFSLPLHWGFVVFGWSILALGGVFSQILNRLIAIWSDVFPEDRAVSTPAE